MANQPMNATPDPDDAEATRLRAAHELLDERPSPAVRAAVLRAAAESARGHAVSAPVGAPRQRPVSRWFGWRPAAAAGATVAVGLLAIGISVHVERESPVESRSATPAAVAAPAPSAVTAPPPDAQNIAPASKDAKPASAPPTAPSLPVPVAQPPAPAPTADRRALAPAGAAAADQPAQAPAAAPSAQNAARSRMRLMQAPETEAAAPSPALAPKGLSADQAAPPHPYSSVERARVAPASPDDWLRRIVELRRAGKDAEADDELARFRAAFPDVKVPADALK
jgi:hypothetical protein